MKGLKHLRPSTIPVPVTFGLDEVQHIHVRGLSFENILAGTYLFYEEGEKFVHGIRDMQAKLASGQALDPFVLMTYFIENCPNLLNHVIILATGSDTPEDREMLQYLSIGTQFDILDACGRASFNTPEWVGKAFETVQRAWRLAAPHQAKLNSSKPDAQPAEMDPTDPDLMDPDLVQR